jgi:hypothetical protein
VSIGAAVNGATWEVFSKIHRDVEPFSVWDRQWLKQTLFLDIPSLRATAEGTEVSKLQAIILHVRPVVVPDQVTIKVLRSRMAGGSWVVVELKDSVAKGLILGDVEAICDP